MSGHPNFEQAHTHTSLLASSESSRDDRKIEGAVANNDHEENSRYEEAVEALNSLQSNASVLKMLAKEKYSNSEKWTDMLNFMKRANITLDDLATLSVVHVSGTKGKGSTCAFTESLLRHAGYTTGFFSSPHLIEARERIRLNGLPLSKAKFTKYFWRVYNPLWESKDAHGGKMPPYFRFLTLLSFHVFLNERPDVVILEVGIGGEYDCTNIIPRPEVTGVASLGLDHVQVLGNTIEKIAWQKAGIFKPSAAAFTSPQQSSALDVLFSRAEEKEVELRVCPSLDEYAAAEGKPIEPGLNGTVQRINASLALQLAQTWGRRVHQKELFGEAIAPGSIAFTLNETALEGLATTQWYGRNQVLDRGKVTYFLDGAHTVESVQQCIEWFESASAAKATGDDVERVLLFSITGPRDPSPLIQILKTLDFDRVAFCQTQSFCTANVADQDKRAVKASAVHDKLLKMQALWNVSGGSDPNDSAQVFNCIWESLYWLGRGHDVCLAEVNEHGSLPEVENNSNNIHVLITGSLYLVGGTLNALNAEICG